MTIDRVLSDRGDNPQADTPVSVLDDPLVRAVLAAFPGAHVADVRVKPSVQTARKGRS